jgi:hypothetical protein
VAPVERCTNHSFEIAQRLCGECGRPFCTMCLVSPFPRRPPLCHRCAVALAGVRSSAKAPKVRSRKEIKAFEKERRMAEAAPEPGTPRSGGFGAARPSFSGTPAAPSRPPARTERQGEAAGGDGEVRERPRVAPRNRPLGGLAR